MLTTNRSKPKKLSPGDKIAAVSPSWGGPCTFPHRYEAGKRQLEAEFGVTVVEMPNALKSAEWIKKNPKARADDIHQAFSDPSINGIICTIGGDESIRTLPFMDLDLIRKNPKVFMGYSDSNVSAYACYRAGIVSFIGPVFMTGLAENTGMHRYTVESIRRTLFSSEAIGVIEPCKDGWTVEMLNWSNPDNQKVKRRLNPSTGWKWLQGSKPVRGKLLGGCIEVVDWLRGTEFWPSADEWKNAVVFLESSEEAPPPVAIQRILRAFIATGALRSASAILFGRPGGHDNKFSFEDYDRAILEVLRDEAGLTDIPIVTQMDFGHTDPIMTLPLGIEAEVDPVTQRISILESAVV